jgi:hypothetical protein
MTKIAGSGSVSVSISQRRGSADPEPGTGTHQNVMCLEHWQKSLIQDKHPGSATLINAQRELEMLLYRTV